ncbi:hypothetical protein GQ457_03G020790 [Hibiscus cannabinus]
MFMKKASRVIDAKFGIGLEEGEAKKSLVYVFVLDIERGEAKILDSLPKTRSNSARVVVVKKLIKMLGECFSDEKFVEVFGLPYRPFTELCVMVAKVKHQDNGYIIVKLHICIILLLPFALDY